MINLQRLRNIGEQSSDEGLRGVVEYILAKIQRDKSEFSRYNYEEDWVDFDQYINKMPRSKRGLRALRDLIYESRDEEYVNDSSFERTLLQRLEQN